jgi:hypothetical protein
VPSFGIPQLPQIRDPVGTITGDFDRRGIFRFTVCGCRAP